MSQSNWVGTSASVARVMRANRKVDTRPELRLRSAIHRRGLRFRRAALVVVNGVRVRPDVLFRRARMAVFVDGCFWHACPEHGTWPTSNEAYWTAKLLRNVARDALVNEALSAAGWLPVRIWEHEVTADIEGSAERVESSLARRLALSLK